MPQDPVCGMDVKETSPWQSTFKGQPVYFCSEHCLRKFSQENKIELPSAGACCPTPKSQSWYRNKTLLVIAALAAVMGLSLVFPWLVPFRQTTLMYLKLIWWAVLLGLFIGGLMDHYIPREYFTHLLAKPHKRVIFYSVGLGFFMSLCSHGILALAIQLYKKGASTSSVVAFLLASPWANFPLTLMLVGFFGVIKGLYIILVAVIVAVTTGFVFQFLEKKGWVERNTNTIALDDDYSILKDFQVRRKNYKFSKTQLAADVKGVWQGTAALSDMVLWWILIGVALASLGAYVPQHLFHKYMGPTALGLLVTLALATVLEVCSEGTAPLAFEIYRQTGALGNSFVFLMAGVVTDYTEIGLLWHNIGKKTALWLPLVTVPQVIVYGILANILFSG